MVVDEAPNSTGVYRSKNPLQLIVVHKDPAGTGWIQNVFDPLKGGQVIQSDEMRGGDIRMLKESSEFRTNVHIGFRNVE